MQRNHCAPSGSLCEDLSLLYVMFTLSTHAAPKSKHMALYAAVYTSVKRAAEGNLERGSSLHVGSAEEGFVKNTDRLYGSVHLDGWKGD